MTDERTYIKVHDGLPDHPKVEGLSDKAFRLLIETWCWSSRHLADGRMPKRMWLKRGGPKARRELVDAGLVVICGDYVEMHDYLEHQRSAQEVDELKEVKRQAGRFGNHKRWHVEKNLHDPECEFCLETAPPEPPDPPSGPSQTDRTCDRTCDRSDTDDSAELGNETNISKANGRSRLLYNDAVTNPDVRNGNQAENAATSENPSQDRSQVRSHPDRITDRKTSPETETETEKRTTYVGSARYVPDARELNATATRHGATGLVARWRTERGVKLTHTTARALAKEADRLLGDGADPGLMLAALDDWAARGKTTAFLRNTYDDQAKAAIQPQTKAGSTGSKRLDKALGYLDPDDPYRMGADGDGFTPRLIEGGRSA